MRDAVDIAAWLGMLGLDRYEQAFQDNDIEVDLLPELTEADFERLGVASLGHRKLLVKAAAGLRQSGSELGSNTVIRADQTSQIQSTPIARSEAERRQLTVMFVDLVGSTALSTRLDPEDLREVIRSYQNAVAGEINRFKGHVAKFMGDGVLAYFGWPRAHEDDAERAVRSGLNTIQAMVGMTTPDGQPLAARIGIATGLVVVGDLIGEGAAEQEAVVGETPNLAARLQALAEPGQILIASSTRQLLGDIFELADLGVRGVKGIAAPVQTFAVTGERAIESRFEARIGSSLLPLHARDQELALLLDRWTQAKTGEGQGVLLLGEAGIGKSRLCRALLDTIATEPHRRIRYQCSPYRTDSALWPVIQQLMRAAGLSTINQVEARLDKLEALLDLAGERDAAPLIADLLSLEGAGRYGELDLAPQVQRARTLDALVRQLLGLAANQPVLVILEDTQWIDPTTLELIEHCLSIIADARVLLLLTSRTGQQPELAARPHITSLTLNRLGRAGVEAIVAASASRTLPAKIIDAIIARADGVPLFVEELTRAMLETSETTVPASLHDTLMARLDRIPDVKEIAQVAACIGREFPYGLLAATSESSDIELQAALTRLASAELVFQRGVPPNSQYIFKHALVRDAAYESLLKQRARQIHSQIAAALVDRASVETDLPHDLVATHLLAAGRERDALPHMLSAARLASQRYAYPEALKWLTRMQSAIDHIGHDKQLERLEMDLYVILTPILMAVRGYADPETAATAARAIRLCTELDDYDRLLPVLFGRLSAHSAASEIRSALEIAERIREIGTKQRILIAKVVGHRTVGFCRLWMGQLGRASDSLIHAVKLSEDLPKGVYYGQFGQDPAITARILLAYVKHLQGYLDVGISLAKDAVNQAETSEHPLTIAYVMKHKCLIEADRFDLSELKRTSRSFQSICEEYDISQWQRLGPFYATWTRLMAGELGVSSAKLEGHLEQHRAHGFRINMPHFLRMLATALIQVEQFEKAEHYLDEASNLVRELGEHWMTPELLRCRAALTQHQAADEIHLIEQCLKESCQVAKAQGAWLSQLRAACDLARLWSNNGERQKACEMLTPIYSSFTEGFDAVDLKGAKVLLDQLA